MTLHLSWPKTGNLRRSPEFIESARSLWDLGLSASEIGWKLGVSKGVIMGVAHRNAFPARRPPTKPYEDFMRDWARAKGLS